MKIYFSGSSDDNFGWEADSGHGDEIGCYQTPGWFRVQAPNGDGLMVFGCYAPEGCPDGTWVIGITLLKEDHPLPDWPIFYRAAENGYSPALVIDAPEGVEIKEAPHD